MYRTRLAPLSALTLVTLVACQKPQTTPGGTAAHEVAGPRVNQGALPPERPTAPYPAAPQAPPPVPNPPGAGAQVPLQRYITVDQFGYLPSMQKFAVIADPHSGWNASDSFQPSAQMEVRRWSDAGVVFEGRVVPWNAGQLDLTSGDVGYWFNFSGLTEEGTYYLYDPQHKVRSHPFEVSTKVYAPVLRAAFRMFYFNRANFEKRKPFACLTDRCWEQAADYVGPGQDRAARSIEDKANPKSARDLSGGWWDAGDTNKYVTFANEAVHQLLTAYSERPDIFTDDFGIPESANGLPDVIDEVLIELDWLRKMQPEDLEGGALLKVGHTEVGEALPKDSHFPRFYYPEACSSATIATASMFAHGALVLRQFPRLRSYAQELKERAVRAWDHYHSHPKSDSCDDGRIQAGDADQTLEWQAQTAVTAAVYLFSLTKQADYSEYVTDKYLVTRPFKDDRWSVYEPSQGDALIYYSRLEHGDASTKRLIRERKLQQSESIDIYRMRPNFDLYRAYMRDEEYTWGSNFRRATYGNTNYDMVERHLVKDPADAESFTERAAGMLHSFHGVNPMQITYLTNMYAVGGDACADEIFHTWFRDQHPKYDNARTSELGPAPGYVTAGPNKEYCETAPSDHACKRSPVRQQPEEKAYLDSNTGFEPDNPFDKAWELTEPSISMQAAYLRLVSKFAN